MLKHLFKFLLKAPRGAGNIKFSSSKSIKFSIILLLLIDLTNVVLKLPIGFISILLYTVFIGVESITKSNFLSSNFSINSLVGKSIS